jgi:hypothetical protein
VCESRCPFRSKETGVPAKKQLPVLNRRWERCQRSLFPGVASPCDSTLMTGTIAVAFSFASATRSSMLQRYALETGNGKVNH